LIPELNKEVHHQT